MAEIKVYDNLAYDTNTFFVDRVSKFGRETYTCGSYKEAMAKAKEIAAQENVLFVYVWN